MIRAYVIFLSHSLFLWDKRPRLIRKQLSFSSELRKVTRQFEPPEFLYSARVDWFPAEWNIQGLPLYEIERVSCRSEWLTDCIQLLHYVLMLCQYAPVFALTYKKSRGIHYPPPLCLGIDPLLPHTSPQMSGYIASHTMLLSAPLQCSVSRPACHCQQAARRASKLGLQAYQHLPGGPEITHRHSRARSGWASCGVERRWIVLRRKTDEGAEALPWLEHMLSPVIPEPVGHLWMEPLVKAGIVTVCNVVSLSFFLAEPGSSAGTGTPEWAENSWPIQSRLLPCRKPSPYPLSLAHQHPQTHREDLARCLSLLSPLFFAAFVSPGCLLSLDLVNRINGTDKADWSE